MNRSIPGFRPTAEVRNHGWKVSIPADWRIGVVAAMALLAGCAHSGQIPDKTSNQTAIPSLEQIIDLSDHDRFAEANSGLETLLEPATLNSLAPDQQYTALSYGAYVARRLKHLDRAQDLYRRTTALPQADSDDWRGRFLCAIQKHDGLDAAESLATLARRWPEAARGLEDEQIYAGLAEVQRTGNRDARYDLLLALFQLPFIPRDWSQASELWRDLALMQLERNDPGAARESISNLSDPYVLISVQADNRFAAIRAGLGDRLDVNAAALRLLQSWRAASDANPNKLEPLVILDDILIETHHYDEALQRTDAAIARASVGSGEPPFVDYARWSAWLLDDRSRILRDTGPLGRGCCPDEHRRGERCTRTAPFANTVTVRPARLTHLPRKTYQRARLTCTPDYGYGARGACAQRAVPHPHRWS